ncbi:MAG: TlpA disulfide reductase family protein [Anaerovoracaceae bacterium]
MINKLCRLFLLVMCIMLFITACGSNVGQNKSSNLIKDTPRIYREILAGFEVEDLNGKKVTDKLIKNTKYTLVTLWGTDCQACIKQMEPLQKIYEKYKSGNFGVLGIMIDSVDDYGKIDSKKIREGREIIKKAKVNYQNITMPNSVKETVLKDIISLPVCFVVDNKGNVVSEIITGSYDYKAWEKILDDIID